MKIPLFLLTGLLFLLLSCGPQSKMSPKKMLAFSGRESLPTQEEFPEDGAVILFDDIRDRLFLNSYWKVNVEQKYHRSILYLNDKAEDWITHSIYLDPDISLHSFFARTIKPNGEILDLTQKDLHPTNLQPDFVTFSDEQSVKFTFPGVEPGSILEYGYTRIHFDSFYRGDIWYIQSELPKLYTRFTVEIPSIFFQYDYKWTSSPKNIELGPPKMIKNIATEKSRKDRSRIFYWELSDIPALEFEPNAPPYRDIAMYVNVDLQYDSWNELTENYWENIKKYFQYGRDQEIKILALDITAGTSDEESKIQRIYEYTQQKYRYLATNIGQSGFIPNNPKDIIKNKYGDCKDMTTLNVNLLSALDIDAYPALINTKSKGRKPLNLISYDFNHMITYVKTKEGKEFWLDAVGSSCPLGEIYPETEGIEALVIFKDGSSKFIQLPGSKCNENKTERKVIMTVNKDGSAQGEAHILFTGNSNLHFRSVFKDASESDMRKTVESWVNANTPNLSIDSLGYDDPAIIDNEYRMTVYFHKEDYASQAGKMLIFKPGIFHIDANLDRYRDIKRNHKIVFDAPYTIDDYVEINYDPQKFAVSSFTKAINLSKNFAHFRSRSYKDKETKIVFKQTFEQAHTFISAGDYQNYRDLLKSVAKISNENIVLNRQ